MWQIINEYVGLLIIMIGVYLFGKIVIEKKDENNLLKDIRLILLFTIPQTIIKLNLQGTDKTILMTIVNVIFIKQIYNLNYKKSIFVTFIYMAIFIIPDLLELFFLTKIMGYTVEECQKLYSGTLLANLTTCIIFLGIVYVLRKSIKKLIITEINDSKKIIIFSILIFICTGLLFYTLIKELSLNNNVFLYLFAIIVLFIVLFSLIKQTMINDKITNDYDKLLEFMKTYEEEIENQRTLRHETKNEFLAIRSKICDKEKEKTIIDYIDEILGDTYLVKNEKYAKFGYLPANGVKGLCYFKTQKAEEQGISVSINISKKIQSSTICNLNTKEQRDFAKILGVFIDNAIEASAESKDKELGIEAYSNLDNEFRMIISNTYNNEIDEEKIGKENFTTKGKNRGHGLLLVNQLVKKNNIFDTKREIKNNIYSQTIIVKNRQK